MSFRRFLAFATLSYLFTSSLAASVPRHDDHDHSVPVHIQGAWHQSRDHPVNALFKRDGDTDGVTYPAVGSPTWTAAYPSGSAPTTTLPQAWVDALNAAVAAGKIPNIPQSRLVNGNPTYPTGNDPNGATVCSTTVQCMLNPDVVWDAPSGVFASSFDDGPLPASTQLYNFLQQNGVHSTHFFIGTNILQNPTQFSQAFANGDDIAVHTWTHPYMTTLSNLQLLGEFGWTMEIIHNSTGGRVPKYWRPPYGDADNRVIAIAKEVFGLTTVIWNQDTNDWAISEGGQTNAKEQQLMTKWLTGPKSPGLIILEHELDVHTVTGFISAFPLIKQNGWNFVSLAQLNGSYQNSASSTDSVTPDDIIYTGAVAVASSSSSASPSPSSASGGSADAGTNGTASSSASVGPATGSSKKQNSAGSTTLETSLWQFKGLLAACVTVALSLVAVS